MLCMTTVPGEMMNCHSAETRSSTAYRSKMAAGEARLLMSSNFERHRKLPF